MVPQKRRHAITANIETEYFFTPELTYNTFRSRRDAVLESGDGMGRCVVRDVLRFIWGVRINYYLQRTVGGS